MAFAEFDGVHALRQIQTRNDDIRKEFLLRTRVLERIRADLYVSGTYVRDYLLEPESGKAESHRYKLLETRKDMDSALQQYQGLLNAPEARPFQVLHAGTSGLLEPAPARVSMEYRSAAARRIYVFCATKSSRAAWPFWGSPIRLALLTSLN